MKFGKMADGTKFYIVGELYVKVMEESTHYNAVKAINSSVATTVMDEEIFVTEAELKDLYNRIKRSNNMCPVKLKVNL